MNSIFKAFALAIVLLCTCSVHAQQNPASIDASTCLDKAQLTSLEALAKHDDILALRTLRLYYFSCVGDRKKLLAISKKAAEIGVASDVEVYASNVEDAYSMKKAFPIYLQAAQMGEPLSQYTVATAYRNGNGVPKDVHAALMWLDLGSNCHGHADNDWGLINMKTLANYLLAERPVPLAKLKGLAWLNILAHNRGAFSSKEKAARQSMLASLSPEETKMVDEFTSEFADQAGCTLDASGK